MRFKTVFWYENIFDFFTLYCHYLFCKHKSIIPKLYYYHFKAVITKLNLFIAYFDGIF